jgi:hypothetical protein
MNEVENEITSVDEKKEEKKWYDVLMSWYDDLMN